MTQPPKRLLETETGALRDSLWSAKGQLPSDAQLAQMAERLARLGVVVQPPVAPAPPAPAPPAPAAAKSIGLGAKAGLGIAGVGTAAVLAFALTRSHDAPPPTTPIPKPQEAAGIHSAAPPEPSSGQRRRTPGVPRAHEPPSDTAEGAAVAEPSAAERAAAPEDPAPEPRTPEPRTPEPRTRREPNTTPVETRAGAVARPLASETAERPTTASGRPAPEAETPPAGEVDLLKRARDAVASDPARALALARRHGTEFPNGAFAQEREFITISALVRLGRRAEADALASSFRARYRRSAYLPQLERLLGSER